MTMVSDANAFTATLVEPATNTIGAAPHFGPFGQAIEDNYRNLPEGTPVFVTNAADKLWDIYLGAFPEEHRQEHNCNCCKQFIRNIGSIVTVDDNGQLHSVLWCTLQDYGYFNPVVEALAKAVENSKITGLYMNRNCSGGHRVGVRHAGGWESRFCYYVTATKGCSRW